MSAKDNNNDDNNNDDNNNDDDNKSAWVNLGSKANRSKSKSKKATQLSQIFLKIIS